MSVVDAQRFAKDLTSNKELAEKVKTSAAGLASLVELGKANGYSFSMDELKQVIRGAAKRELTDDQLEVIAGGQGNQASSQAVVSAVTGGTSNQTVVITVLDYTQTQVVSQANSAVVTMVA
ncbi:MAG: Nif11-like leader peptide family natural product precursor [Enhydrobacter sp.]|nr:MAG: Nif11-like leader peptide family natural product precursor [Enhydrobacter sp.]